MPSYLVHGDGCINTRAVHGLPLLIQPPHGRTHALPAGNRLTPSARV